ncbi:MAG: hypothetical protein A2508_09990 [Candidatus Lambdaproteobacteria bacterium RIFOXYD12_FULL_49_8]|uniref:Lipoprotein n=1 Tax=Candidatus Lambdaproteobacteria bacterium RIFOXYD2_FULL_50_16 TaxID=1817772 RepID=A0A1F6GFH1_9PROT|nr:MAG: hypothetical protein A2527_00220 [Candidatus Lambdaproteobacteria bacterium RIFOXYD2_FULL_50_16]OGG97954.1 MAG: hypothetical protein A2508_09990 [Candidatus Lambdaproteobacteria bacterium RIFOXYD12_FULL_49_8]
MNRFCLILLSLVLLGCSSARNRDGQTNLISSWEAKDDKTQALLEGRFKSGNVYLDYDTVFVVDALFRDLSYRKAFLDEQSKAYFYPPVQAEAKWAREVEDYQNFYSFVVVIYTGDTEKPEFGEPSSHWQVFLGDDESDLLRPVNVKKLAKRDQEHIFLTKYFKPVDRWVELYRISFPKLNREVPLGDKPFSLIFSGLKGSARLEFSDRSLFYQSPEDIQP